jgi:hypothetical protein
MDIWSWRAEGRDARRREMMAKGNARADGVKARTDELVAYVKRETGASGAGAKRAAALAATSYERAWMWAERAFLAEDFVAGDDGGSGEGEPPTREMFEENDGQSDA